MNLQQLLDIASRANDLQKEDVSELVKYSQAFPYFQLPKVLLAKYELSITRGKEKDFLASAAISSPNRAWLKTLIEGKEPWAGFNQLFLEQLQKEQGPSNNNENFIDDLEGELTPRPKKDVDLAQKISVLKRLGEELHEKKPSEKPTVTEAASPEDDDKPFLEKKEDLQIADEPAVALEITEVSSEKATIEETISVDEPKEAEKPIRKKRKSSDDDLIENIRKREKKEIKDEKKKEQIDIIKAFSKKSIKLATIQEIEANHTQSDLSAKSTEINERLITESYAKLLAKQNKKTKAIEIYQKLIVKFPDKSTYFADQIKNLEDN
ncbi:MAG: hypothetical protein ACXIUD_13150 [Mongoliitalea sp.]